MKIPRIFQGWARPFNSAARLSRNYIKRPLAVAAGRAAALSARIWHPSKRWLVLIGRMLSRFLGKPLLRFVLIPAWNVRRPIIGLSGVAVGAAIIYGGVLVLPMQSPQENLYNQAVNEIRKDFANERNWASFVTPEVALLQKSLLYYNHQAEASLIDRLLYGEPNVEYAAQANLKIGVILLYNAKDDQKLIREARDYLETAVKLNPGILYPRDLPLSVAYTDRLSIEALAAERNLEMLYKKNPETRTKKPGKDGEGEGDGDKNGDQRGQPDQPNDQPGDPKDGKQDDKQGQASMNKTLQQNMNDVQNGTANDGI
jgi:hypothetical protein